MDVSVLVEIIKWLVIIALGVLSCYFRAREDILDKVEDAIVQAEETYQDASHAGGLKFEYAINWLYNKLPAALKLFISKDTIAAIVQNAFDMMESYVFTQMDHVASKVLPSDSEE